MSANISTSSSATAKIDRVWNDLIGQSKIIGLVRGAGEFLNTELARFPAANSLGSLFKIISICLTVLLFICLTLPQFTNDKQGLAIIVVAAAFFWFSGKMIKRSPPLLSNFIDPLVILFFCISIISTFSSHYFAASVHGLLKLVVYVIAYFLFSSQIRENPKYQFLFVGILLLGGAVLSLDGLYQYKIGVAPLATWEDPNIENQTTRIYATFNNPNLFAGYLVPLIMLAACFIFACWQKSKWLISLVPILLTALLSVALVLTGSRGGYLGIGGGFIALTALAMTTLWQQNKKMRPFLLAAVIVTPLIAYFLLHHLAGFEHRITSIFVGREHSSNSFRLNVWLSSLAMLKDNWLIGVGVGNQAFRLAYGLYMRSGFDALGTYCVPLEIAVETGVCGLIVFGLLIGGLFYRAHLVFWTASTNLAATYIYRKWLISGAALAIFALLVHGLVDTVFFRPQVEFIFFLLVSIIVANSSD